MIGTFQTSMFSNYDNASKVETKELSFFVGFSVTVVLEHCLIPVRLLESLHMIQIHYMTLLHL